MEAYKVPRYTKVKILDEEVHIPPASIPVYKGDIILIENLDGMYCNCLNTNNERVYISAWTEVEPITTYNVE